MGLVNAKSSAEDVKTDEQLIQDVIPVITRPILGVEYINHMRQLFLVTTQTRKPRTAPKPTEPRVYKSKSQKKHERTNHIHDHGYIYLIINSFDNLKYIGSTVKLVKCRMWQHELSSWDGQNRQSICRHIRELKGGNFEIVILADIENTTKKQLRVIEEQYIIKHKTMIYGLNVNHASGKCRHGSSHEACSICRVHYLCLHNRLRRSCTNCKYDDPMSVDCIHHRTMSCCHICNRCAHCNVLCTPEHRALPSHVQRVIKATRAAEHKADVAQIIKQAVHRPGLFRLE
jgi:hypothetical protein